MLQETVSVFVLQETVSLFVLQETVSVFVLQGTVSLFVLQDTLSVFVLQATVPSVYALLHEIIMSSYATETVTVSVSADRHIFRGSVVVGSNLNCHKTGVINDCAAFLCTPILLFTAP